MSSMLQWLRNLLLKLWNWGMHDRPKLAGGVPGDESPNEVPGGVVAEWAEESVSKLDDGSNAQRLEEEEWTYKMFDRCVNEEKSWADYLFKDGSMIGLNDKLLQQYVEWIANRRLKAIGMKPVYDIPAAHNPLPWTQHWISSKGLQVAPQETEVESYVVGGIKQDVKKDTFSGFKL